jgi:hypothetical protein
VPDRGAQLVLIKAGWDLGKQGPTILSPQELRTGSGLAADQHGYRQAGRTEPTPELANWTKVGERKDHRLSVAHRFTCVFQSDEPAAVPPFLGCQSIGQNLEQPVQVDRRAIPPPTPFTDGTIEAGRPGIGRTTLGQSMEDRPHEGSRVKGGEQDTRRQDPVKSAEDGGEEPGAEVAHSVGVSQGWLRARAAAGSDQVRQVSTATLRGAAWLGIVNVHLAPNRGRTAEALCTKT